MVYQVTSALSSDSAVRPKQRHVEQTHVDVVCALQEDVDGCHSACVDGTNSNPELVHLAIVI